MVKSPFERGPHHFMIQKVMSRPGRISATDKNTLSARRLFETKQQTSLVSAISKFAVFFRRFSLFSTLHMRSAMIGRFIRLRSSFIVFVFHLQLVES
jgi:hypothetical protein